MKLVKGILAVSFSIFLIGAALFLVAFGTSGWDADALGGVEHKTALHEIDGEIRNIDVDVDDADVTFVISEGETTKVVCNESNKNEIYVTENGGRLMINEDREWYDYIFDKSSYSVVVYLPAGEYGELMLEGESSDVTVPAGLVFSEVEIEVTSGEVDFAAGVRRGADFELTSGDVKITGCSMGSLSIDLSSGDVDVRAVAVEGKMEIESTSGDISIFDVTFKDISVETTSGDSSLSGARGENAYVHHTSGVATLHDAVLSDRMVIESTSGEISFDGCDAGSVDIRTTSGDVDGTFLTPKTFDADSTSGDVRVPYPSSGDPCRIRTTSGDINILVVEDQ